MSELIGTELRSRTEANKILANIANRRIDFFILDFNGVSFISRSFADELCSIIENLENNGCKIHLINESSVVSITLKIVLSNRNRPKNIVYSGEIKIFNDMEHLSEFLSTI